MRSVRCLLALALNILLVQSTVLDQMAACALGGETRTAASAVDATTHEADGESHHADRSDVDCGGEDCAPKSTSGGCGPITTCAVPGLPVRPQAAASLIALRYAPVADLETMQGEPRAAPDLPPPRV